MSCMQEWLLMPWYPFGLSPLNVLYRGKLVSSIIVNIPYLLELTVSIISSNILKDFENASPGLNPLIHKNKECQREYCY